MVSLRSAFLLAVVLGSQLGWADANLQLIQDLKGTYPVVEYMGSPVAGGTAEIFVDDTQVGIKLLPLKLSSHPILNLTMSSPKGETVLKRDERSLVQTFENGPRQTRIEYSFNSGYLVVEATQCDEKHCVKDVTLSLSQGRAPGKNIPLEDFLKKVRGNYIIQRVGGESAHEEVNTAEWSESEEPGVESLRFPYCQPQGCDPGFLDFKRADMFAFEKDSVTTLMVNTNNKRLHFSWEELPDGSSVFTQYQYKMINKDVVALEFVLKRK